MESRLSEGDGPRNWAAPAAVGSMCVLVDSADVPLLIAMPIRLGDLDDDEASLELRCRQCGRSISLPGKLLAKRYGAKTTLAALLTRMRCEHDRMVPDARIVLDPTEPSREAYRRRLPIHRPRWD